ncbi:MAG: hypothetical protein ACK5MD_08825 [Flavobacteriales bacterium]
MRFNIDYNSPSNILYFNNKENNYKYDLNFFFEGVGSQSYLFGNNKVKILILEFEYEYNYTLFIFKITDNNFSFLKQVDVEIQSDADTFHSYILQQQNNILVIDIQFPYENRLIEIKDNNGQKIEKLKTIDNDASGSYKSTIQIIRGKEAYELDYNFKIQNSKAVLNRVINGEHSTIDLTVTKISENDIVLTSKANNEEYIIRKKGNEYKLSGQTIYLLNPPNNDYVIVKSEK